MVVLIACANVGNLLLSRAATRQTEISGRVALGGSRLRLIRPLLTESILLAAFGAACGLLLAHWAADVLFALVAGNSPLKPHLNVPVLAFTIVITVIAGILFGLAPAFSAGRIDLVASLRAGVRSVTSAHNRIRATHSLIVAQIAISPVLLVGANLPSRSLLNLEKQPLGFDQSRVLLAGISTRMANYKPENVGELYRNLYARLSALPGVRAATLAHYSPMSGSLRAPANVLRDRLADVLSPADLAKRHRAYHYRVMIGPSYRADMWAALERNPELSTAELARRTYGSFATAWRVKREFVVLAS
jgi:FtsX-like permease family protein